MAYLKAVDVRALDVVKPGGCLGMRFWSVSGVERRKVRVSGWDGMNMG